MSHHVSFLTSPKSQAWIYCRDASHNHRSRGGHTDHHRVEHVPQGVIRRGPRWRWPRAWWRWRTWRLAWRRRTQLAWREWVARRMGRQKRKLGVVRTLVVRRFQRTALVVLVVVQSGIRNLFGEKSSFVLQLVQVMLERRSDGSIMWQLHCGMLTSPSLFSAYFDA